MALVSFQKKKMGKIASSESMLNKEFGVQKARIISRRLVQLKASDNLSYLDLMPLRITTGFHRLKGNRSHEFAMTTVHPFRIIFIADDSIDDKNNLSKIDSVVVIDLDEQYHDK